MPGGHKAARGIARGLKELNRERDQRRQSGATSSGSVGHSGSVGSTGQVLPGGAAYPGRKIKRDGF